MNKALFNIFVACLKFASIMLIVLGVLVLPYSVLFNITLNLGKITITGIWGTILVSISDRNFNFSNPVILHIANFNEILTANIYKYPKISRPTLMGKSTSYHVGSSYVCLLSTMVGLLGIYLYRRLNYYRRT